jgi:hypothetical protein
MEVRSFGLVAVTLSLLAIAGHVEASRMVNLVLVGDEKTRTCLLRETGWGHNEKALKLEGQTYWKGDGCSLIISSNTFNRHFQFCAISEVVHYHPGYECGVRLVGAHGDVQFTESFGGTVRCQFSCLTQ